MLLLLPDHLKYCIIIIESHFISYKHFLINIFLINIIFIREAFKIKLWIYGKVGYQGHCKTSAFLQF